MAYIGNPVNFDGTNDYLSKTGALSGATDGKQLTFSAWVRRTATGANAYILGSLTRAHTIRFLSTNLVQIFAYNASNAIILNITSTATIADSNWHHLVWSIDLASEANRHFMIDGSPASLTIDTYNNDTIDWDGSTAHAIGATTGAGSKFSGDMADVQMWLSYVDLSQSANLELFYKDSAPVDPATASASLGTPIVLLSGATDTWQTNDGSGAGFTENGALTDGSVALPVATTSAAIPPDAILASTNLSGAVTAIDDDPDAPGADWLTASSATSATDLRVSFPTPG